MNTQPEALRLAKQLESDYDLLLHLIKPAAAELRRLHEVNQELVEALEFCAGTSYITDAHCIAEIALAKARGNA